VLALANLDAIVARRGARGYPLILLQAGFVLHRAWLCAVSLGLAGCLFEGLLPIALQELGGDQLRGLAPLLAFAVGVPPFAEVQNERQPERFSSPPTGDGNAGSQ
jgi:hypothetical protein